jgi:hypothetical protein
VAGVAVACNGIAPASGHDAAIAIRQHEIRIDTAPLAGAVQNLLPAVIVRNVFLGNCRDYMVELGDGTQIRVVASPQTSIAPGSKVSLHLPPERCLLLDR